MPQHNGIASLLYNITIAFPFVRKASWFSFRTCRFTIFSEANFFFVWMHHNLLTISSLRYIYNHFAITNSTTVNNLVYILFAQQRSYFCRTHFQKYNVYSKLFYFYQITLPKVVLLPMVSDSAVFPFSFAMLDANKKSRNPTYSSAPFNPMPHFFYHLLFSVLLSLLLIPPYSISSATPFFELCILNWSIGLSGGSDSKVSCLQCGRPGFNPWVGKILWRRKWQPTPVLLPGKSHGQRSVVGCSPRGRKESDTTSLLLSFIGFQELFMYINPSCVFPHIHYVGLWYLLETF